MAVNRGPSEEINKVLQDAYMEQLEANLESEWPRKLYEDEWVERAIRRSRWARFRQRLSWWRYDLAVWVARVIAGEDIRE